MKEDDCSNDPQSFILRIWNDADSGNRKTWRGSIVHVGSGNRIYFHNLKTIPRFIQKQIGMESGGIKNWVKSILGRLRKK